MYFPNHLASSQPDFVWSAVVWSPSAHGSGSWWAIGREARASHAARKELVAVALEDGSVEPKPREPLYRRWLQVKVVIREFRATQRWL